MPYCESNRVAADVSLKKKESNYLKTLAGHTNGLQSVAFPPIKMNRWSWKLAQVLDFVRKNLRGGTAFETVFSFMN